MGVLVNQFKNCPAPTQPVTKLGINRFQELAGKMTCEVKEEQCLDYYYTEGIIEVFSLLKKMLSRLDLITVGAFHGPLVKCRKLVEFIEYFVKHEIRDHLDADINGCVEGFHCLKSAVNGECDHVHTFTCQKCHLIARFWDSICNVIAQFSEDEYQGECESMLRCIFEMRIKFFKFLRHFARSLWQKQRIVEKLDGMDAESGAIYIDHKKKVNDVKIFYSAINDFFRFCLEA